MHPRSRVVGYNFGGSCQSLWSDIRVYCVYLLSCTVSEIWQIISPVFAVDWGNFNSAVDDRREPI